MGKSSHGQLGVVLYLANVLLAACSSNSSSNGDLHGGSGAAGTIAGASAHAGTNSAGDASNAGDTAGNAIVGSGGAAEGGTQGGDSGGSAVAGGSGELGGAQNVFVAQISLGGGGGAPLCLPRALPVGPPGSANDGRVACLIAELKPGTCDCSQTARAPLPASVLSATRKQLQLSGACDGGSGVSCDTFCGCEIEQTPGIASDHGSELYACQNDLTVAGNVNGFCVIDQGRTDDSGAPAPLGNPALVAECPANEKRQLRFVGAGQPSSGATAFIGCTGSPVN